VTRPLLLLLACAGCLVEYTVGGPADACPTGQVLCAGACAPAGACDHDECPEDQDLCAGACAPAGACDHDECPEDQDLCAGACVPAGTCDHECPAGLAVCGSDCTLPDTCACDRGCDADRETCAADVCVCRDGLTRCGGACVDTRADPDHCGDCEATCPEDQPVCQSGACAPACAAPLQACGGACVDTTADALHCGRCDDPCKSDEQCVAGECRDYTPLAACDACPCPAACPEDSACCDVPFLGAPACVDDGCT
jgi:hypothetical protein